MGEMCGARFFSKMSNNAVLGQLWPAVWELRATPWPLILGETQAGPKRVCQPMIPLWLSQVSPEPQALPVLWGMVKGMMGRDKHRRLVDVGLKDTGLDCASRLRGFWRRV